MHPSVHRHTDGADHQDQTHPNADHHIGRINDGTTPRGSGEPQLPADVAVAIFVAGAVNEE